MAPSFERDALFASLRFVIAELAVLMLVTVGSVAAAPSPDSHLPAAVCATLTQERAKLPTPPSQEQLGAALNNTAWAHRADHWGLSKKEAGNHCPSKAGSIACDVLMLPDGSYWDVFVDAGGTTTVNCGVQAGVISGSVRGWVAPADPGGTTQPPPVDPPPVHDCSAEQAQIASLRKELAACTTENQRLYDQLLEWDKRLNQCLVDKDALQQKYDHVSCTASIFGIHIPCTVIK